MISPEERAKRRYQVDQVHHSSRMEGREPSPETIALSEQWVNGDITIEEWIDRAQDKYRK